MHDSAYTESGNQMWEIPFMQIRSLPLTMALARRALREAVTKQALQVSQPRGFPRLLADGAGTCVMASMSKCTLGAMVFSVRCVPHG